MAVLAIAPRALPQESVLRSVTRLVQIQVLAQDKEGNPVRDLKQDDFAVSEEGKTQTITFFSSDSTRPDSRSDRGVREPGIFANRPPPSAGNSQSVTVILLDGLNTRFENQYYARAELARVFSSNLKAGDHVALYTLGSGLRVVQDFTTDSAQLLASLNHYRQQLQSALAGNHSADAAELSFDHFVDDMPWTEREFLVKRRREQTADAVEAIANHLAGIPGRKNLIWVSDGFPNGFTFGSIAEIRRAFQYQREAVETIERIVRALSESNVAVYPVDARGLVVGLGFDASRREGPVHPGEPAPLGSMPSRDGFMEKLARRTGGVAYRDSNDIRGAVRTILDTTRFTYTIGWYPTRNQDDRFHNIAVRVRRSGVRLYHRQGYFALDDASSRVQRNVQGMRSAIWSPLAATGLGVRVKVTSQPAVNTIHLDITIELGGMALEREENGGAKASWNGKLRLLIVEHNAHGDVISQTPEHLLLQTAEDSLRAKIRLGISLGRDVAIEKGATELRTIVQDETSGALGSVIVPLAFR